MANLRDLNTDDLKRLLDRKSRLFICEHYQISRRTLNRILKERGLTGFGLDRVDDQTVGEIRLLYRRKQYTQKELADKYNVSQSLISKIVNDLVHRNVTNFVIGGEADVKMGYKHGNS